MSFCKIVLSPCYSLYRLGLLTFVWLYTVYSVYYSEVLWIVAGVCAAAVQQERRPPDVKPERLSQSIATSVQKIYIRKDFSSPSTAIPTFTYKVCVGNGVAIRDYTKRYEEVSFVTQPKRERRTEPALVGHRQAENHNRI